MTRPLSSIRRPSVHIPLWYSMVLMRIEITSVDKRTLAICLTNRAQCHIRVEEFGTLSIRRLKSNPLTASGTAIEDATKALAADPTYHKVRFPSFSCLSFIFNC